jgi:hypothetical protein
MTAPSGRRHILPGAVFETLSMVTPTVSEPPGLIHG